MKISYKIAASVVLLGFLVMPAYSQGPAPSGMNELVNGYERAAHSSFVGIPTDWSTGHLAFTQPESGSETEDKVQQDPRYWIQQIRHAQLGAEDSVASDDDAGAIANKKTKKPKIKKVKVKKDWSESLGAAGATTGANFFPAKYSYGTGVASCNDYVTYNTSLAGSTTQASIIAFDNIYQSTCSGTVPTTAWSYDTSGTVLTSVTPSFDGTQVAFIHSAGGGASLEILRPVKGQGSSATSPALPNSSTASAATYVTCKAGSGSCLLSLAFNGGHNDTASSPYYVFTGTDADTIFVGDDSGFLHKFTGVFNGTPAEVTAGGFPFQAAVVKLSGAIYNEVAGTVEVNASYDGTNNGARLHEVSVDSGSPTATNSTILGATTAGGVNCAGTTSGGAALLTDAPLIDPSAGRIYVFIGNDGAATANSVVYQFTSGSVNNSCGTKEVVGAGSTGATTVYSGAFDNIYLTSASSSSPSGNIYVCGNAGGDPTLYRVPITANVIGAPSTGPVLTTAATVCSPVTEFLNGTRDRAYLSVNASGKTAAPISCPTSAGCLMSFTLSATTPTSTTAAVTETGGTSGIVIDNSSAQGGASQIYFSTLGGATAIQASQAGLN